MPGAVWYGAILITTIVVIIAYGTLLFWLSQKTGWPEAYGSYCRGRGCLIEDLRQSPALLHTPNSYTLAMFAALWCMPAMLAMWLLILMASSLRKRLARWQKRIRPMKRPSNRK